MRPNTGLPRFARLFQVMKLKVSIYWEVIDVIVS